MPGNAGIDPFPVLKTSGAGISADPAQYPENRQALEDFDKSDNSDHRTLHDLCEGQKQVGDAIANILRRPYDPGTAASVGRDLATIFAISGKAHQYLETLHSKYNAAARRIHEIEAEKENLKHLLAARSKELAKIVGFFGNTTVIYAPRFRHLLDSANPIQLNEHVQYPLGIQFPNSTNTHSRYERGRQYDRNFLLQFQNFATDKPTIDWDIRVGQIPTEPAELAQDTRNNLNQFVRPTHYRPSNESFFSHGGNRSRSSRVSGVWRDENAIESQTGTAPSLAFDKDMSFSESQEVSILSGSIVTSKMH